MNDIDSKNQLMSQPMWHCRPRDYKMEYSYYNIRHARQNENTRRYACLVAYAITEAEF